VDEAHARAILRELLAATGGRVGEFVPDEHLASSEPFARHGADEVIDQLLAMRWLRRKNGALAATRAAVEFAIDWAMATPVLRAIADLSDGGWPFRKVTPDAVAATTGFPSHEVSLLIEELSRLEYIFVGVVEVTHQEVLQIRRSGLQRLGLVE
jgi:hypothetical protein